MYLFSNISYRLYNQKVESVHHPGQVTTIIRVTEVTLAACSLQLYVNVYLSSTVLARLPTTLVFSSNLEWRQHYTFCLVSRIFWHNIFYLWCFWLHCSFDNFLPASTATVLPGSKAALPTCFAAFLAVSLAAWLVNVLIRYCKIESNIPASPSLLFSLLFHAGQAAIKLPSAEASRRAQCTSPGQYAPYIKGIMKTH